MNITRELLTDLGIVSMNISKEDASLVCHLAKAEKEQLFFKFSGTLDFSSEEKTFLSITTRERDAGLFQVSKAEIAIMEHGLDYAFAKVISSNETIGSILRRIAHLEYQDEKYGRRKEPRIPIGKANAAAFGLSSPEQKIYAYKGKTPQPCVIVDASLHGVCIITPYEEARLRNIDNFIVQVSFTSPEQSILLQAHKVHIKLNHTENKTFATISCQLLEPISYIWKERVIKMLELTHDSD